MLKHTARSLVHRHACTAFCRPLKNAHAHPAGRASVRTMASHNEHDGVLELVNKQFALYNARDLEGFMSLFAEDAVAQDAQTDQILAANKAEMRQRYEKRFSTPVHAELLGRLCLGPVVCDREVIYGLPDNRVADCLATYVVDTSKSPFLFKKVKFVWKQRNSLAAS